MPYVCYLWITYLWESVRKWGLILHDNNHYVVNNSFWGIENFCLCPCNGSIIWQSHYVNKHLKSRACITPFIKKLIIGGIPKSQQKCYAGSSNNDTKEIFNEWSSAYKSPTSQQLRSIEFQVMVFFYSLASVRQIEVYLRSESRKMPVYYKGKCCQILMLTGLSSPLLWL